MAAYCTNCAAPLEPGVKFCASCGLSTEAASPPHKTHIPVNVYGASASAVMGRRYRALRIVAFILKIAAVLWAIIRVIGLITSIEAGSDLPSGLGRVSSFYGVLVLLTSIYFAVMSWAGAELLHVFMDIEENTRRAILR